MRAKRRWFQFSLRTLVVVMLLVSLVLGYWGYARRRAQRQWEAVRAIREAGGTLQDNNGYMANPLSDDSLISKSPTWQRRLGIECPQAIAVVASLPNRSNKEIMPHLRRLPQLTYIRLKGDGVDDECLEALSGFLNLNHLYIESNQITDTGALGIARHTKLESLELSGERLTDRGMMIFAHLPELRSLEWKSAKTTGEGLVHLRNHPQLFTVHLHGTTATDVGFEHLSTCANLECLEIDGPNTLTSRGIGALARIKLTQLTFRMSPLSKDAVAAISNLTTLEHLWLTGPLPADDFAHLSPLVSLRSLRLKHCELTGEDLKKLVPLKRLMNFYVGMADLGDEDMELLASFPILQSIDLSNSALTDAGLMKLVGMKQLNNVYVGGTKVTAEGAKEFEQLAPNVNVEGEPKN